MMIEQTVICEKATFPPRPFQFTKRPQLFVIKYLRMRRVHSFTLAPPVVLKLVIWNINIQLRLWHQNYTLVHYTDKQKQHTHFVAHICPLDKNPGGYPGWADTRWTVTITVHLPQFAFAIFLWSNAASSRNPSVLFLCSTVLMFSRPNLSQFITL